MSAGDALCRLLPCAMVRLLGPAPQAAAPALAAPTPPSAAPAAAVPSAGSFSAALSEAMAEDAAPTAAPAARPPPRARSPPAGARPAAAPPAPGGPAPAPSPQPFAEATPLLPPGSQARISRALVAPSQAPFLGAALEGGRFRDRARSCCSVRRPCIYAPGSCIERRRGARACAAESATSICQV
jgi:hypothetical protein